MKDPRGRRVRFGIRARVAATFSALIVLLILLFGTVSLTRFGAASEAELQRTATIMRENLVRKGLAMAQSHALGVENALAESNFEFLVNIVRTAAESDPDLVYGLIADPSHRVLVHSDPALVGRILPSPLDGREAGWRELPAAPGGEPLLEVAAPVGEGEDRLGTLRFGLNLRQVGRDVAQARLRARTELRRVALLYLAAMVGFVLLGLASAYALSTRITRPLSKLTREAQEMGRGKLDVEVRAATGDEVGILASTLDGMRLAIQRELADLRTLHDVGKALAATLVEDEVARAAFQAIRERCGARRAAMYVFQGDARGSTWRLCGAEGFPAGEGPPAQVTVDEAAMSLLPREVILLPDGTGGAAARSVLPAPLADAGPGWTTLVAPLQLGARLLGVIALADRRSAYEPRDLQLIDTIASSVAQSLENIRLLEATAEQARIDQELRTAQAVHRALIPAVPPRLERLDVAAAYLPATEIGGDWYGFLPGARGDQLHVLIGDVTGHGVPAALLAACACASCEMVAHLQPPDAPLSPARLLDRLNPVIQRFGREEFLMTFFAARLDVSAGEVVFASAGHNPPYHLRTNGDGSRRLGYLTSGPTPLLGSSVPGYRFAERRAAVAPGDVLVFYTDGLLECEAPDGKPWGYQPLERLLKRHADETATSLRDRIMEAARVHYGSQSRADDVTLVVVKVAGGPAGAPAA